MKSKYPSWETKAQREYYQKNREKIIQQKRKWRDENREEINRKQRIRNQSQFVKEIRNKWNKIFLEKNGITRDRAYYLKNKEKLLKNGKTYRKAHLKQDNNSKKERRYRWNAIRKYCFTSIVTLCIEAIESDGKRIPITKEGLEFVRELVGFNPYYRLSKEEQKAYVKKRDKASIEKYGLRYCAKRYQDKQKKLDPNYKRFARRKAYKIEVPSFKRKRRV